MLKNSVKKPALFASLLQDLYDKKNVNCPICGKGNLVHSFHGNAKTRVGCALFKCEACGAEEYLSRIVFPENVEFEEL